MDEYKWMALNSTNLTIKIRILQIFTPINIVEHNSWVMSEAKLVKRYIYVIVMLLMLHVVFK